MHVCVQHVWVSMCLSVGVYGVHACVYKCMGARVSVCWCVCVCLWVCMVSMHVCTGCMGACVSVCGSAWYEQAHGGLKLVSEIILDCSSTVFTDAGTHNQTQSYW